MWVHGQREGLMSEQVKAPGRSQ